MQDILLDHMFSHSLLWDMISYTAAMSRFTTGSCSVVWHLCGLMAASCVALIIILSSLLSVRKEKLVAM